MGDKNYKTGKEGNYMEYI